MDYALAHFNMIEQQIRPWDVLDMRILDVMAATPRHPFVPDGFESLAYSETPIPLNKQFMMLEPKIIARFLQATNPQPNEKALEVGTGSGYQTALLAKLCQEVDSIELDEALAHQAKSKLTQLGHQNIHCTTGNAYDLPLNKEYDVIVVNGSVAMKPEAWLKSLTLGGRCVAVVGTGSAMQAVCYTRTEYQQWNEEALFETELAPLVGPKPEMVFSF
ncbi:MAG: protein-L-isoaspartate O-methyltransferase [Gammaproteobacteria bacterium]|nr:protein-L-isoaspartate O-methyltransferase [Gammaproteobacteria bacterium]